MMADSGVQRALADFAASPRLVVATRNAGKLREFRSLLEPAHWEVIDLREAGIDRDHEETGLTFAENARLKALSYSMDTDLAVLADDSGLEVFALGGRPGVYSARYAGAGVTDAGRIEKLLRELGQSPGSRDARFVCALALARKGLLLAETEGDCRGWIADSPRGDEGFGYDPIFFLPEMGRTYAELKADEKNRVSHRANAVAALLRSLQAA